MNIKSVPYEILFSIISPIMGKMRNILVKMNITYTRIRALLLQSSESLRAITLE